MNQSSSSKRTIPHNPSFSLLLVGLPSLLHHCIIVPVAIISAAVFVAVAAAAAAAAAAARVGKDSGWIVPYCIACSFSGI